MFHLTESEISLNIISSIAFCVLFSSCSTRLTYRKYTYTYVGRAFILLPLVYYYGSLCVSMTMMMSDIAVVTLLLIIINKYS